MDKIKSWVRDNQKEFWILIFILVISAFCRLYKIDQYMTFLGDEGRDVLIVRRIFTEFHPPLIGPGTSVGQMYLGPLYYYMMAPALLIANFSPVGPAIQIALLGVATVWLVWFIGRGWFGKVAGFVAATLYAISPTVITYSHSSWNPNIMPFFALLSIYSIWKVWKENRFQWLLVLGVSFAFVMQSHYLGLLLVPTLFLFWVLVLRNLKDNREFLKKSSWGFLIFAVLMSPLLFFDLRHNFMNARALVAFVASRDGTVLLTFRQLVTKIPDVLDQLNTTLLGVMNPFVGELLSTLFITTFTLLIYINIVKKVKISSSVWMLVSWVGFGVIGFAFYKLPIYDHYFGFLYPAPFLLIGAMGQSIFDGKKVLSKVVFAGFFIGLFTVSLINNPLRNQPNRQLARSEDVAKKVLSEEQGRPFDLAVLAERNYEDGYRYFMELWGGIVLHADRWDQKTIVDDLIVVCEKEEITCDPTHSSKAEVANFGMSKIDATWYIDGVVIYRLIHLK